eukprot:166038-Prymnesium_polylepis.1
MCIRDRRKKGPGTLYIDVPQDCERACDTINRRQQPSDEQQDVAEFSVSCRIEYVLHRSVDHLAR